MARPASPTPDFVGGLGDGTLLGTRSHREDRPTLGPEAVFREYERELFRMDSEGQLLNSVAILPGADRVLVPEGGAFRFGGLDSPGRRTFIVPGDREIYVARGDRFEVLAISPDGGGRQLVRREHVPAPLTPDHLVQYFGSLSLPGRLQSIQWDRVRWDIPDGRMLPAIANLVRDEAGNLGVQEGGAEPRARATWSVYSASGTQVATAAIPPRLRPFLIEGDEILGVWKDEFDVEYVQVRRIDRR